MELGKPYPQIVFYLCIASEFKETFENNCETASSAEFKNQAKSIPSILENPNGNVNDDALDDFFINDFNLDYLNPATKNQEFTLNSETPIFKPCTTVLVNNQENQAQIMENQTSHNTNQFMLQQTIMNQPVTQIPHHKKEENKSENENLSYAESMEILSAIFLASSDYDSHTKLIVRRRRVWNDSNEKLKRFLEVNIKPLEIEFVGEEAVD